MSKFYPFNSAAEVAKNTFYTEDEIIKMSQSESEYGRARFKSAIDCAVGCNEFSVALDAKGDLPKPGLGTELDISKMWHKTSRCERGQTPTLGLKGLLK